MRAFLVGFILFLYGCGATVKNENCELSVKKSVAWRNLMPSLGKGRKGSSVTVKVYLKKGCALNLSAVKAKLLFEGGFCESKEVFLEKEPEGGEVVVVRGCENIPVDAEFLDIDAVLEDKMKNIYKISVKNVKIRKVY